MVWMFLASMKLKVNLEVKNTAAKKEKKDSYFFICFNNFFTDCLDPHQSSTPEFSSQGIQISLMSFRSKKLSK